jgi:CRISPR/Cas system Type II protein with McrA/HNH and RuvC-like nuclease domain
MCGFVNYSKNQVLSKADEIREAILDLMINDNDFIECISNRTGNSDNLKKRFRIYMDMLESIISKPTNRIFRYSIKEQLFNQNPTCAISGQKILKIEDAEVDHIVPYSKGGETTLSNAQLVLRYFNRSKKDNQDYKIVQ